MSRRTIIISFFIFIILAITATSCSVSSPANYQPPKSTPTSSFVHQTLNLVHGIITVKASGWYYTSFTVSPNQQNIKVLGSFTASGGSGNDIIALILDSMDYTNWSNGHQVNTIYNSGQLTVANINVTITAPGTYYLVFNNTFSLLTAKEVTTNVNLEWDELTNQ